MSLDKDNSNQQNQEGKRKRRPRSDNNQRNYICSCGKSYLSYPALYTHIKNKHEGKAPGTIQMPRAEKGAKLKKYNFRVDDDQQQHLESSPNHYIDQFVKFFELVTLCGDQYQLSSILELFPPEDSSQLLTALADWQSNTVVESLRQNGAYDTDINRVLVKFMLQLQNKIEKGILAEVATLLIIWKKSLQTHEQGSEQNQNKKCHNVSSCLNMLQIVNDLMGKHFRESMPKYQGVTKECYMLDQSNPKLLNKFICKFIYIFSKWLFAQKYVNTRLGINRQSEVYELE